MATDDRNRSEEEKRQKAREHDEARKRAKAPRERVHSKKGITTHATEARPHAAGHRVEKKKDATEGEQGAHPGRGRPKDPAE